MAFLLYMAVSTFSLLIKTVVMYRCESWTVKKAECWRSILSNCGVREDSWECLGLQGVQTRSSQSVLTEINPEYSWEELMMKLKLQYFGCLMGRANSLEETLMLGKIEGRRRRGRQRMRWLDGITNSMEMTLGKLGRQWRTGKPGMLQSMGVQRIGHDLVTKQQQQ